MVRIGDRINNQTADWRVAGLIAALLWIVSSPASAAESPRLRVVSMNPSLTAILVELGGGDHIVAIDDYSARQNPSLAALPRVGGLFDPNLEAVVAARPDRVILVPSVEQRDFQRRLGDLGIHVDVFENIRFDEVLENIERLGAIVGREDAAAERIAAIRHTREALRIAAAERDAPSVLVVLDREPLFVVGGGTFIDEMLETLGVTNLGRQLPGDYPRASLEWLITVAPEILLDMSSDPMPPQEYWARWSSVPAVAKGRALRLQAEHVTLPGPRLDRSLRLLAEAIYGEGFVRAAGLSASRDSALGDNR